MTWTTVDDTEDREPTRAPQSTRTARVRRALAGALVGAVLLGVLAWLVAGTREASVSASALVVTGPDPASVESPGGGGIGGDAAARNATYVETELVFLRGADLADRLAEDLDLSSVEVEAEQVGESSVIEITTTAADAGAAEEQAQAAADLYIAERQRRLTDRIAEQSAALDAQIAATDAAIRQLGPPPATGFDTQIRQRDALSQRYADQLAARDSLQRAAADVPSVAGLVQSATATSAGVVSTTTLLVIIGVVVGALLGAAAPWLLRSLVGRVQDEADLTGLGIPVLSPALPGHGAVGRHGNRLTRAVQLQALRMSNGPANHGSLAVLAPTPGVGATFTAVQHALHAARRGRTLLVLAAGGSEEALTSLGVDPSRLPVADLAPADGGPVTPQLVVDTAHPTSVSSLSVVVPGAHTGDDAALERGMAAGLVQAALSAGWAVVVDTAPLDRSDSGLHAARQCGETVVVAGVGHSTVEDVERSAEALRAAGIEVTGIVVTHPRRHRPGPWRRLPQLTGAQAQAGHREQVQGA